MTDTARTLAGADSATTAAPDAAVNWCALVGRILLALIFVLAGIGQLGNPGPTVTEMANHAIPYPNVLVWGAIVVELAGGLGLVFGLFARWAAVVLFFYTLALAIIFHPYWTATGAAERTQHALFFGHLSMMGGLLYVVAFGAGAFSLDAMMREK